TTRWTRSSPALFLSLTNEGRRSRLSSWPDDKPRATSCYHSGEQTPRATHAHPNQNRFLLLRTVAHRGPRRAAGRRRLPLPRLPTADGERVRGARQLRRALHGPWHSDGVRAHRRPGRAVPIP